MISGIIGWATLIASIIWAVKGEMIYALGFLVATGMFWCAWNISTVQTRLHELVKLNRDKILAEKTLAALMSKAKEE